MARPKKEEGDFRLRKDIPRTTYTTMAIWTFIIIFAVWFLVTEFGSIREIFLPSPKSVLEDLIDQAASGTLWSDMGFSIYRVTMGFLLSVAFGVPLGILTGCFRKAEAVIAPICEFIRYMPVPAFVPLIMVWFGIGETAKIMIVFLGCFFQLVLMIADDTMSVSDDLLASGYTLGTKRWSTITKVLIPAMAPKMMLTLRMMIGWGWTYLTVSEMVAASSGLGYSILRAQRFLHTASIFSGILVIGLLGLVTDRLFALAIKKMFPWAE
ncbi:MAG: ABC transporter permease [Lachnospiraceae bacterium]